MFLFDAVRPHLAVLTTVTLKPKPQLKPTFESNSNSNSKSPPKPCHAKAQVLVALLGASMLSVLGLSAQAEVVTRTTLAHNSTAQYANEAHMPYANPQAPKGGTLSLSAAGTFNAANKWMTTGVPMAGTDYLYDTF